MLFCQLPWAHSLREVCGGLACCEGKLKHLGIAQAPKAIHPRHANQQRPWQLLPNCLYFRQLLEKRHVLVALAI